ARHGGPGAAARRWDRQPGESAARLAARAGRGSQLGAGRDRAETLPDVDARGAVHRLDHACRWRTDFHWRAAFRRFQHVKRDAPMKIGTPPTSMIQAVYSPAGIDIG